MKTGAKNGLLVGAGFLAGTLGLKALTSKQAKNLAVQGAVKGLQVKAGYENIVEQAKAEIDDIVAEANYINVTQTETSEAPAADDSAEAAAPKAKK